MFTDLRVINYAIASSSSSKFI